LTQDQRLGWIHELLTGSSEALPYRVAGMLLLLYAQPLVRIVALQTSDVASIDSQFTLRLGKRPVPSPNPSPSSSRPTLRIGRTWAPAPDPDSPWLFPSARAGQHLHPNTVMDRLGDLGINLLAARNRALGELVLEVPPPLVAHALGYSHQVALQARRRRRRGAWARYSGQRPRGPRASP
jgi:hypothetical protein